MLHQRSVTYGTSAQKHAKRVKQLIKFLGAKSVLDYGAGKQALKKALGDIVISYDPAIPGLEKAEPADLVVCLDVMEHVEPDFVDAVLDHVFSLARSGVMFVISCEKGTRRLPNGRLAHCSVHPPTWWMEKISQACAGDIGCFYVNSNLTEVTIEVYP